LPNPQALKCRSQKRVSFAFQSVELLSCSGLSSKASQPVISLVLFQFNSLANTLNAVDLSNRAFGRI